MRYKFLIILLFFGILIMFLCLSEFIPVSTPVIRGQDGKILENSVTMLEKIEIGGMEQWILIRGNDISNPVLLWLHGGPGASQMSVSQYFNGDLEKDFIVVHWDQRGAGKSNPSNFNEKTMTIEQYVSDTHELTIYLKNKFGKEKIYLLGHSWGALLGIETVKNYPEDYYAYIGVSQPVSNDIISQSISYEWLSQQMLAKGNQKELKKLKDLGEIPYIDHDNYVKFANMVSSYGGGMDLDTLQLALISIRSKEYRLSDYLKWLKGAKRGSGPMWESYRMWNSFREVPRIDVPVYFFSGKNDYNTPLKLVQEYYSKLEAPKGKKLIIFYNSAHAPFMKESFEFNSEVIKVKQETYDKCNSGPAEI